MPRHAWAMAIVALILLAALIHRLSPVGLHCLLANLDVTLLRNWSCPGVGILVIDADLRARIASFGFASAAMRDEVGAETLFPVASLTKQFTGLAVAILSGRGEVSLEGLVSDYIEEFTKRDVTVGQLVYHTSGIPDYLEECRTRALVRSDDVLAFANAMPLEFPPGERFAYSNTNYVLLAILVERVTGEDFREWMRRNVFSPLQMRRTGFSMKDHPDMARAFVRPASDPPSCDGVVGDGGLVTTLNDYAKWLLEISRPAELAPATVELMLTPGRLSDGRPVHYAFGWVVTDEEIQHEGAWAGFEALVLFDKLNATWNVAVTNYIHYDLSRIIDHYWLRHFDDEAS